MVRQTLFCQGQDGYASYRIPSLISLPGGRVLAFCEGRVHSAADYGTIHLLMRKSDDGGATFGVQRVIAADRDHTLGNPTPVYSRNTGRLFLFLNGNRKDEPESMILKNKASRTACLIWSDDLGETWSPVVDLTAQIKRPGWTWYAFGPCHAIQMKNGRMVVPANHGVYDEALDDSKYVSHVVISDDDGATWRLGGDAGLHNNECTVAELPDGRLYLNMRNYEGLARRSVSCSADGGETWTPHRHDEALVEPVCQGVALQWPEPVVGGRDALLFANPADPSKRVRYTVRMSFDGGERWAHSRVLHEGPASYGDLTALPGGQVGCLFECGEEHAIERIDLIAFPIDWIKEQ